MDSYLGQIFNFGGNFAPRNWAHCDGQILPIAQFDTLYAVIGTQYGGDGTTTLGLPNLKGRMPIASGNGVALSPVLPGQQGGAFRGALSSSNLPAHNHHPATMRATTTIASGPGVTEGSALSASPPGTFFAGYVYTSEVDGARANLNQDVVSISKTGGADQFTHYPPLICIPYIICVTGLFPSRN